MGAIKLTLEPSYWHLWTKPFHTAVQKLGCKIVGLNRAKGICFNSLNHHLLTLSANRKIPPGSLTLGEKFMFRWVFHY
jgi:hypothetical protein